MLVKLHNFTHIAFEIAAWVKHLAYTCFFFGVIKVAEQDGDLGLGGDVVKTAFPLGRMATRAFRRDHKRKFERWVFKEAHHGFDHARSFFAFFARTADRKSTRLNSSHVAISYAVFCLKK